MLVHYTCMTISGQWWRQTPGRESKGAHTRTHRDRQVTSSHMHCENSGRRKYSQHNVYHNVRTFICIFIVTITHVHTGTGLVHKCGGECLHKKTEESWHFKSLMWLFLCLSCHILIPNTESSRKTSSVLPHHH